MIQLDTQQLEQLREIGSYLGQIRQDQSKSLEEINTKTYIPLKLLKAIEAGQDQPLPEPVFIQGLIRRYAEALGLNGKEVSQRFNINPTPVMAEEPALSPVAPANKMGKLGKKEPIKEPIKAVAAPVRPAPAVTATESPRQPAWQQPIVTDSSAPSKPPYLWIFGVATVAIAGLFFSVIKPVMDQMPSSRVTASERSQPSNQGITSTATSEPKDSDSNNSASNNIASSRTDSNRNSTQANSVLPATTDSTTESPTESSASGTTRSSPDSTSSTSSTASKQPLTINVSATEEAWIEVVADGKVVFEGTLQKGDRKSWSGKQKLRISSGNAGAVKVAFNNGKEKAMGQLGAVKEQTYTPKTKVN